MMKIYHNVIIHDYLVSCFKQQWSIDHVTASFFYNDVSKNLHLLSIFISCSKYSGSEVSICDRFCFIFWFILIVSLINYVSANDFLNRCRSSTPNLIRNILLSMDTVKSVSPETFNSHLLSKRIEYIFKIHIPSLIPERQFYRAFRLAVRCFFVFLQNINCDWLK